MNPIEPYSFSAVSHALGAIASLVPAWFIYRSYKKHPEEFIKYFMLYFLLFGIAGVILSAVEFIFPKDTLKQGIGILFSTPFFYVALAYFFMVPASLKFPKLKKIGFWIIIGLGVISFILNVIDIHPTTINDRGLIDFKTAPYVGEIFLLMFALAWLPAIAIFIYEAIKNKNKFVKIRSVLLAIGLLTLLVFGQMHDVVKTWQGFLLADVLTVISYFILMAGVLYRGKEDVSAESNK